uniref:Uncharacterized protein n=1 Tax=Davidia involucrata TaxID=16924 RepID=A0A5B6ZLV5_DAVIN
MVQLTLQTKHVPGKNFSCLFRVLGLVRLHFFIELDWNFLPFYILNAYFKLLLGIFQVAFNPITVNSIKKTLSKICREEQCKLTADQIDLIAKSSGGDIRQAITSLQYFCLKPHPTLSLSFSNGTPTYSKERSHEINRLDDGLSLPFGRDETLSLFHALGKFLHNKRETENSVALDKDAFVLRERFARLPLKMDAPEKVLCQAHGQARPIADFLHENGVVGDLQCFESI